MKKLGKGISFETAIGMNGRIWLKAKSVKQTLSVARAISASEHMDKEEMNKLCQTVLDRLAGFWLCCDSFQYIYKISSFQVTLRVNNN